MILTFWERHDFADFDSGNVWVSADEGPYVPVGGFTGAFQVYSDDSLTAYGWYIDDIWIGDNLIFSNGIEEGDFSGWPFR